MTPVVIWRITIPDYFCPLYMSESGEWIWEPEQARQFSAIEKQTVELPSAAKWEQVHPLSKRARTTGNNDPSLA